METGMLTKADHGEDSYVGSGKLAGRKALIAGGDSGIGRAVAIAFAREDADVSIPYLNKDADAQETARLIEAAGGRALLLPGAIAEEARCVKIIDDAGAAFGGLDILVNNVAYQMSRDSRQKVFSEEWTGPSG